MGSRFRVLRSRQMAPRATLANARPSENPGKLSSGALAWRRRLIAFAACQARRAPRAPAGLPMRYSRRARKNIPGELSKAERIQRRSRSVGGGRRTPTFADSRSPQRLAGGCSGSRGVVPYRFPLHAREGLTAALRAALRGAPHWRGSVVRGACKQLRARFTAPSTLDSAGCQASST